MTGVIEQVSISRGGVPKLAIPEGLAGPLGIEGDMQTHTQFHGGPRKALLLISREDLDTLASEGFPVSPGALGENLTISGIDFRRLRSGQRFRAGEAVIELTTLRRPCLTLDRYNTHSQGLKIQSMVYDAQCKAGDWTTPRWARAGFYAAVFQPGRIRPGDIITLLDQAV